MENHNCFETKVGLSHVQVHLEQRTDPSASSRVFLYEEEEGVIAGAVQVRGAGEKHTDKLEEGARVI